MLAALLAGSASAAVICDHVGPYPPPAGGELDQPASGALHIRAEVHQVFRAGGWEILYAVPDEREGVFLFYADLPTRSAPVTLRSGAARTAAIKSATAKSRSRPADFCSARYSPSNAHACSRTNLRADLRAHLVGINVTASLNQTTIAFEFHHRNGAKVSMLIGTPICVAEGEWRCPYKFVGFTNSVTRWISGADEAQALDLALRVGMGAFAQLDEVRDGTVTWLGANSLELFKS